MFNGDVRTYLCSNIITKKMKSEREREKAVDNNNNNIMPLAGAKEI